MFVRLIIWITSNFIAQAVSFDIAINNSNGPRNLEAEISSNEDIFPSDLQISIYLTRSNGLLFYTIDELMNQLIVNLDTILTPTIHIEFRGENYYINFTNLCNCLNINCLYQKFNFHFRINEKLYIQCNEGKWSNLSFVLTKEINEKYPIPAFDNLNKNSNIWLVNIPFYKNPSHKRVYPNNNFLTGCISDVKYKGDEVKFKDVLSYNRCHFHCKPETCNGGKCIETFNSQSLCDCQKNFYNGRYCNSYNRTNLLPLKFLKFQILKISWKTNLDIIFIIANNNTKLELSISPDKKLQFIYTTSKIMLKNDISNNYSYNKNYILLIKMENKNINLKFDQETVENQLIEIPLNHYFDQESFYKMDFLNNNPLENGDVAFKTFSDEVIFTSFKLMKTYSNQAKSSIAKQIIDSKKSENIKDIVIGILGVIIIILIIIIIIYEKIKYYICLCKYPTTQDSSTIDRKVIKQLISKI